MSTKAYFWLTMNYLTINEKVFFFVMENVFIVEEKSIIANDFVWLNVNYFSVNHKKKSFT